MKKIVLLTALVFSFTSTLATAKAKFIDGQYYGGVGLGLENYSYYSNYDPGVTIVFNGGKPIIKLGPGTIGAELELTYTLLDMDYDSRYSDWSVSALTFATYATYTYKHSKKFYSRAKFGFALQSYSWSYNDDDDYYDYDDYRNFAVAVGIGGGYNITKKLRLFSDLNVMSGGLQQINFGVQMSF